MTAERPPKTLAQQVAGQWPLATVLSGVALGLAIVALGRWRTGCTVIGLSITLGGVLRLLPNQRVGLLMVRSRAVDCLLLLGTGIGITVLAWAVPAM